jgi:hypothetical protein
MRRTNKPFQMKTEKLIREYFTPARLPVFNLTEVENLAGIETDSLLPFIRGEKELDQQDQNSVIAVIGFIIRCKF